MPFASTILQISSSTLSINQDKRDPLDNHFRWDSIKTFLYLASSYSSSTYNVGIFAIDPVKMSDMIILAITIGLPYMFMDFFIKLYTRRMDSAKLLNPLLKGVTYGLFLQSALNALAQSGYSADSLNYLAGSFQENIPWSHCHTNKETFVLSTNTCMASAAIDYMCTVKKNYSISFQMTSSYYYYQKSYMSVERSIITKRMFLIGVIWIINFLISSAADDTLLKIFRLVFLFQTITTIVVVVFMAIMATNEMTVRAFYEIFNAEKYQPHTTSLRYIQFTYGIGFLGLYDFGSMSTFTMVDNSVIIFSMVFLVLAFLRSWILQVLFLETIRCVRINDVSSTHYIIFGILPLSTEFVGPTLLYARYILSYVLITSCGCLTLLTTTMAKIINTDFRSIKPIYISGLINFIGFILAVLRTGISIKFMGYRVLTGLLIGMEATTLYLGGMKVALIMWVYGIKRFATDIQYWLGFKPTKFWTISWALLPIILWVFFIQKIYEVLQITQLSLKIIASSWIIITFAVVMAFHIKTIAKYLFLNNVAGLLSANLKYGPPDNEDRKRRRLFDEIVQLRQCRHNCHALDDIVECNHLPLMERTISSEGSPTISLTNIYEDKDRDKRGSTALDVELHQ